MKAKLGAFLMMILLLIGCCSHDRNVKVTTSGFLHSYKSVTFHADVATPQHERELLGRAAGKIWTFTHGNAEVEVRYDLDYNSVGSLAMHEDMQHHELKLADSYSRTAEIIDARHPMIRVLGETYVLPSGRIKVVLIQDRIYNDHLESVAMHEFGHSIGMEDLKNPEAVMSGTEYQSKPAYNDFTEVDLAECRRVRVCD